MSNWPPLKLILELFLTKFAGFSIEREIDPFFCQFESSFHELTFSSIEFNRIEADNLNYLKIGRYYFPCGNLMFRI